MDHLIPVITSIINEIVDIIENADSPLKDKPNWAKRELLEMIIDCPDTDILKRITRDRYFKDLSFILFNHPHYGYSATAFTPVKQGQSYLSSVYFQAEGIDPSTINALLHRVSTLTTNDFKVIGLGEEINDRTLKRLKEHAKDAVYEWIQKYGLISYEGVGISYQTNELRGLQFETFRALWKAVAYYKDDFFISYDKVFKTFGLWEGFYSHYITQPKMIGGRLNEILIGKLNEFIDESSPFGYLLGDKLRAYQDAKDKLIQLEKAKAKAEVAWLETRAGVLTWFDQLFEPSSGDPRYSSGFKSSELYKAWLVCMNFFELFGTEPMTGYSIPDGAFNVDEEGTFASHHLNRANKASMALYDIILTWSDFHPDPYEAISELMGETRQRMLKYRLRKLFELGIHKDEVQDGNWITEEDFRTIFPDNLEFEVRFRNGDEFRGSLFYLWNDVFTEKSFQDKLRDINDKIQIFRDALKYGKNPYIELLKASCPSAETRFLEKAITFTNAFCRLGTEGLFPTGGGHNAGELAYIWHIYLMRQAFDLE